MDIKEKQAIWLKEKPLFEAELIHSHLLPFFNFNENTGDYEIKTESVNNTDEEDRKVAYESLNTGWAMWLRAKRAKAQAVPEGFVLVSKERLAKAVDGIEALFKEDCTLALGELLPIQQDLNDMIEGLEYTITELSIDWGMECPICNHNEATCYSTATQESSYEFMDGDAVVCLKCGNKGEMDADGENSDIAWDEAQEQGHD